MSNLNQGYISLPNKFHVQEKVTLFKGVHPLFKCRRLNDLGNFFFFTTAWILGLLDRRMLETHSDCTRRLQKVKYQSKKVSFIDGCTWYRVNMAKL